MKKNISILFLVVLWVGTIFFYELRQPREVCQIIEVQVSGFEPNQWVEIGKPVIFIPEAGSAYVNFRVQLKEEEIKGLNKE